MEKNNEYVSSRGILQSCDFCSTVETTNIQKMVNYPHLNLDKIKINPIIYVCGSAIPHFNLISSFIKFPFILVSGDCDDSPNELINFNTFINNPLLLHWFSQNITIKHPKVTIIPIGLDYHTMKKSSTWGSITTPNDQEYLLKSIKRTPIYDRKIKCYANFHFQMNTKYGYDRKDALNKISEKLIYYETNHVTRLKTWLNQVEYAFVISPHGGGYDCHRLWEALILGCIPIVKTSPIDSLYDDLPVLIVNEWSDITISLLENTINNFKEKVFNYDKLTLKYWINKMKNI